MRISDWSSDVCSSDLLNVAVGHFRKEISSARADGADSLQRVHALGPTDFDLMIAALFDQLKVVHRPFGITEKGEFLRRTRSEEHTSELQSLMRISYAVFCLKKQTHHENYSHVKLCTDIDINMLR